jgi:hypothetical protein
MKNLAKGGMDHPFLKKTAVLANGDRVSLLDAGFAYGKLRSCLHDPGLEWEVIHYLRELCFGREIEPEQRRALKQEGFLSEADEVDEVTRSVVLSAVRGEGRQLHLVSPFTETYDRVVTEYLNTQAELEFVGATEEMNSWNEANETFKRSVKNVLTDLEPDPDSPGEKYLRLIRDRQDRRHTTNPEPTRPPDGPSR